MHRRVALRHLNIGKTAEAEIRSKPAVKVLEDEKGKKDRGSGNDHQNWRSTNDDWRSTDEAWGRTNIGADLAADGLFNGSTKP
jgi:hypothetical protein